MPIYTKFGDKGKTSLYGGKTIYKDDLRVEAYGTIDELNSFLGIVISEIKDKNTKNILTSIQKDLFEIGTSLATPSKNGEKDLSNYLKARVKSFEKEIDLLTKKLPQLENFILPRGGKIGAKIHFARALTRRAERRIVSLSKEHYVNPQILIFINRLSDFLFMHARMANKKEHKKEIIWRKR
jgi:cob(I)alamin adenosyltransferase